MPNLEQAVQTIVAELVAAGINAASDPAELNLPGVLVDFPSLELRFGKGWVAAWTLVLAVPNTDRRTALANLGTLLDEVVTALNYQPNGARPVSLQLPDQGAPVPAYEITMTTRVNP
jgi:hypothetical protein